MLFKFLNCKLADLKCIIAKQFMHKQIKSPSGKHFSVYKGYQGPQKLFPYNSQQ